MGLYHGEHAFIGQLPNARPGRTDVRCSESVFICVHLWFSPGLTMPAKLTTHVLDLARGCPAQGVQIELWSLAGGARNLLKTVRTNADGRTDQPLLAAEEMQTGRYELVFCVGDYF